ncbi:hypothetical protein ABZZ47_30395 [Streptomyces sp. NPDC006465]|uniref:hypothetical protein n=1 Tax=Streptomyces sp. NPDC006465 TaxID=3157174 RepID=UPI0033AACDB1
MRQLGPAHDRTRTELPAATKAEGNGDTGKAADLPPKPTGSHREKLLARGSGS